MTTESRSSRKRKDVLRKAAVLDECATTITIPAGQLYVDVPVLRLRFSRGDEYETIKATAIPITLEEIEEEEDR